MTVVVYRDGVMASDSGGAVGDMAHRWCKKMARGLDGALHGISGFASEAYAYLEWVESGYRGSEPKPRVIDEHNASFVVLRVGRDGVVQIVDGFGVETFPGQVPYMAIGCGREVAMGALHMGATPLQAVQACIEHCSCVWGDIHEIRRDG